MDFLNSIPEWLAQASAAALVVFMALIFYALITRGLIPFFRELNDERGKLQAEQRDFYEIKVIPALEAIAASLKNTLEVQRVQYEGKLAMMEHDRNQERSKLVAQIADLTAQIKTLSERIAALEKESLNKDAEIAELRERLKQVETERDTLKAHLAALEAAEALRLGISPDGHGQGQPKETTP